MQRKDEPTSTHVPLFLQGDATHAFTRAQATMPSPENPSLQRQTRDPCVFRHTALTLHPPLLIAHSLMSSEHRAPWKPAGQTHRKELIPSMQVAPLRHVGPPLAP
jgi:hypothetical protein